MAIWNTVNLSEIRPDRSDAEYFRKDYKENIEYLKSTGEVTTLGRLFKYIKRGSQPLYSTKGTIKALRSVNVGFMNFNETRQEYVTEEFFKFASRGRVKKNDILITSTGVGTLGRTSIWYFDEKAYCDGHITILRDGDIDPYFVTAFLNSKYGLIQYDQNYRGSSGQIEIYPYDIAKFVIPKCLFPYQKEIGDYLRNAFDLQEQSQTLYQQATELLEKELGLDNITFDNPKSYTARFSEVINNNRADAEFYNSRYDSLLETINSYHLGTKPLYKISKRAENNLATLKDNLISYIEIGDINVSDGSFEFKQILSSNAPANAKIKVYGGEILISMVRPTRGAISIVPQNKSEIPIICSGAFYVFNVKEEIKREIIWLYFRLIKKVFSKYVTGSSYPTIEPKYISKIQVPLFDNSISMNISKLVKQSFDAKEQSKQLLAQAKTRVEELIEQAAKGK